MKLTKTATFVLQLGVILALAGAGCRKSPTPLTVLPGARAGQPTDPSFGNTMGSTNGMNFADASNSIPTGLISNPATSHEGWKEDAAALKADTVHFDYDSSAVKKSEKPKVAAVADYLKSNPASAVRVEGHCDERGTDEYNRSLGERRALALREDLARLGVAPTRVDTISYGRDRPVDTGRDEAAHRKNRRGEFIVLTAP